MYRFRNLILTNPVAHLTFLFLLWAGILSPFSFWKQCTLRQELRELTYQKQSLRDQIRAYQDSLHRLTADPNALEHFARTHYRMHRMDEDIWLLPETADEP